MTRRKYRHRITGHVQEYEESYAKWVKALEPVGDDTAVTVEDCGCEPDVDEWLDDDIQFTDVEYESEPVFYAGEIKE